MARIRARARVRVPVRARVRVRVGPCGGRTGHLRKVLCEHAEPQPVVL